MKYNEAWNGPDIEALKQEVEKEHKQMMKHKMWEPFKKSVPKGAKRQGFILKNESPWDFLRHVHSIMLQSERPRTQWQFFDSCSHNKWCNDLHYVKDNIDGW